MTLHERLRGLRHTFHTLARQWGVRGSNRLAKWFGVSFVIASVVMLFLVPLDVKHFPQAAELYIVVTGAVFAVIAAADAHSAFIEAKRAADALGSFRMNFHDAVDEMVKMVRKARLSVRMMVPTPAYGYLFGYPKLSADLVQALEEFTSRDGTNVELVLLFGEDQNGKRVPQQYLQRAHKNGNALYRGYQALVSRVFDLQARNPDRFRIIALSIDPNVRILITDRESDLEDDERRACFLSFAHSEPDTPDPFGSKGFRSTRGEMIQAVSDLMAVYLEHQSQDDLDFIRNRYEEMMI